MGNILKGALMGLGQGLSQYGQALTKEELLKQSDARTFDRQVSLQEISQQYQRSEKDADNEYALQQKKDALDPTTELGDLTEAAAVRTQGRAIEVVQERASLYGRGGRSPLNPNNWTQESWTPYISEILRLKDDDPDLSDEEADTQAQVAFPLVQNKTSANASDVNIEKAVTAEVVIFLNLPTELKVDWLVNQLGFKEADLTGKSDKQLIELLKVNLYEIFTRSKGLMGGPPSTGKPDPLGIR